MGNNCLDGLPLFVTKNWHPVPHCSNSYKNKLTNQYAHKYRLYIEDPLQIESFKIRLKESNPYICRVLFYHQYHDNIYHVITEQMSDYFDNHQNFGNLHQKFKENDTDKWLRHKLGIIEAFWKLAQTYGFMGVCRQMIGCDGNGNWKVWIHPDPCSHQPWCIAHLQSQMLDSLMEVLEQIQRDFETRLFCGKIQNFQERNSFSTTIRQIKENILQRQQPKTKNNSVETYRTKNTTNFNININIEVDGKKKNKKQANNTLQNLFNPIICETQRDDEHDFYSKNNFKKHNNSLGTMKYKKQMAKNRPISYYNTVQDVITSKNSENRRRVSDISEHTKILGFGNKSKEDIGQNNNSKYLKKEPKSQNRFLQGKFQKQNYTPINKTQTPLMNLLASKPYSPKVVPTFSQNIDQRSPTLTGFRTENALGNFSKTFQCSTDKNDQKVNKTSRTEQFFKKTSVLGRQAQKNTMINPTQRNWIKTNQKIHDEINRKASEIKNKNKSIPLFLTTNNAPYYNQSKTKAQNSSLEHRYPHPYRSDHPTMQNSLQNHQPAPQSKNKKSDSLNIFYRPNSPITERKGNTIQKSEKGLFQFYANKYSRYGNNFPIKSGRDLFDDGQKRQSVQMPINQTNNFYQPREDTHQSLKDELRDILETPIVQPISEDFQAFKNNKLKYKEEVSEYSGSNTLEHLSEVGSDRAQNQLIKQKVEKKKATFAHLKMQVMKMLEDDN